MVISNLAPELAVRFEDTLGAELLGQGERIVLRLKEKDIGEVLQMAVSAGAEVVSVTPQRASLEKIFLSTVREGGDPAGGEKP